MKPTPRQQEVEDLLDHASEQINQVIERVAALFDDEAGRTLFMLGLYGRFLKIPARKIAPLSSDTDVEAMLTLTYLLAAILDGKPAIAAINPDRAIRRALAIGKMIEAAAGWSLRHVH